MSRFAFLLLSLLVFSIPAQAAVDHDTYYRNAFAAINAGKPDLAETLAARGSDPVLNKVLRGSAMALADNNYSFEKINAFISNNPNWPTLKAIREMAEQKIPTTLSPAQVVDWFLQHPPITLDGLYRLVEAFDQLGLGEQVQKTVRAHWIEGNFRHEEQTAFYARFGSLLSSKDMDARVDRLIWENDRVQAQRMLPYLGQTAKIVAGARLAYATKQRNAASWLDRIPPEAQNDPGLMCQRLKGHVKNKDDDDANEILLNAPVELGNASAWWEQRNIMVRRAIEARDHDLAYRLASRHGQKDPQSLVPAEFLSGWLALRFLDKPDAALRHFQSLYDNASTPISRARGAYWVGRSFEALDNKREAEKAYENAASFSTTYYGQLAMTRLDAEPILVAKSDPPPPESARAAYFAQDGIRAIERLADIGESGRANVFFRAAAINASKREEFILLTEIAGRIHRPDLGIQAVKAANQKNILVLNGGFPLISMRIPTPPEPALTHALIRQESTFNPDAESSAGARGLMQLMPRTAREVCRKIGIRYREYDLGEPVYNLRIGTAFAAQQINRFDGSYILALAGYNAGPVRVHEWIEQFGDPRDKDVDPIDWVELIPIQETRNYIQRIIESLQVYRAKLAGGQARLLIINDLKR
jgi:soluble lytic murein transglycosylase